MPDASFNPVMELTTYQGEMIEDADRFCAYNMARRCRKTWTLTLKRTRRALDRGRDCLMLSATRSQSAELIATVQAHLQAMSAYVSYQFEEFEEWWDDGVKFTKYVVFLPNGARIIAMPARPESLRGYGGDIFLDEFGMHEGNGEAIFAAAIFIAAQEDYECDIASTPSGKKHMFYRVMQNPDWKRRTVDIHEAVRQGVKLDIEKLRKIIDDDDIWAQECLCQFLDHATAYLPYEMIQSCEEWNLWEPIRGSHDEPEAFDKRLKEFFDSFVASGPCTVGVDIGRKHDQTVIWLLEKVGRVSWTRAAIELDRMTYAGQEKILHDVLSIPGVVRAAIDATGKGEQLAENAKAAFGDWVEMVTFTAPIKSMLATRLRSGMEDKLVRIPNDLKVREDCHNVKKVLTAAGNVVFDSERTKDGHCDRFWALALANYAGSEGGTPPPKMETGEPAESSELIGSGL